MSEEIRYVGVGEITKTYKQADGSVIVEGRLGGPTLDLDNQRLDKDWLDTAVPEWSKVGNIRAMHQPISAGKAQSVTDRGEDWWLVSKIVDPVEAQKCLAGLYTGYSVGIKGGSWVTKNGEDWINRGKIIEVSLADYPCDPENREGWQVHKAALGETVTDEELEKLPDADIEKRDFTASDRKRMAGEGKAMPDGSFPIATEEDLHNAVRLAGHAKDQAAAKRHIISRARAMGLTSALPEDWKADTKKMAFEELVIEVADDPDMLALLKKIVAPEVTKSGPACGCCLSCTGAAGCTCGCDTCKVEADDTPPAAEGTDMNADTDGDNNGLNADAEPTTTSDPAAVSKTAAPDIDLTKFVTADTLKTVLADTIKAALSEATKPLEDRLAEMEKRAAPGGPAIVKRQFDAPQDVTKALIQKRADTLSAMLSHPDPRVAADAQRALALINPNL